MFSNRKKPHQFPDVRPHCFHFDHWYSPPITLILNKHTSLGDFNKNAIIKHLTVVVLAPVYRILAAGGEGVNRLIRWRAFSFVPTSGICYHIHWVKFINLIKTKCQMLTC